MADIAFGYQFDYPIRDALTKDRSYNPHVVCMFNQCGRKIPASSKYSVRPCSFKCVTKTPIMWTNVQLLANLLNLTKHKPTCQPHEAYL